MNKYKIQIFILILGVSIVIFSASSMGSFNGLFAKILNLFSIPLIAHQAWMMICINIGFYIVHLSLLGFLAKSFLLLRKLPSKLDKIVFGFSLLLVSVLVILWIVDGSYPVPYNSLELLK